VNHQFNAPPRDEQGKKPMRRSSFMQKVDKLKHTEYKG
jgi:hypothetical protein